MFSAPPQPPQAAQAERCSSGTRFPNGDGTDGVGAGSWERETPITRGRQQAGRSTSSPGAGCPREGALGQPSPPCCSWENQALVGGGYGEGKPLAAVRCVRSTGGHGCWGVEGAARGGDEGICGPVCVRCPAVVCAVPWVAHRGVTFRWGMAVGTTPGWDTSSHPLGDRARCCPWGRGAGDAAGAWQPSPTSWVRSLPGAAVGGCGEQPGVEMPTVALPAQAVLPQCPANLTPWHPRAVTAQDGVMQGDRRGQGSRQRLACVAGCVIRLRGTAHINPSLQVGAGVGQSGSSGTGAVCAARAQPESPCWRYGLWVLGPGTGPSACVGPSRFVSQLPSVAQGSALGLFSTSLGNSGE